ncbi:hypothetical protein EAH89_20880 [Roseomonas nepalensis]|uniref:Uncharacterized protein n=1 Tax=Muricoccus nepalensis TaxID=1854500 RepID=A0A502FK47_9PROT|nr:hypothetical protein [Roseomonas nepalensis]TPG49622.1 hypothetical protein EAH89_20880 [Roseomonas nepalensis]
MRGILTGSWLGWAGPGRAGLVLSLLLAAAPALAQGAPGRAEREAVVVNETGLAVRELYLAPGNETDPGPDRLGADTLPPGGSLRLRLGRNQPCAWSLRAILADETQDDRRIDLCRSPRVVLGDTSAPSREAIVNNDTDLDLRELYAAPPGAPRGPDRLGAEVVPAGRMHRLRLGRRRDCVFDITAVLADGTEVFRPRADICRSPRVTLADPSLHWRELTIANGSGRVLRGLHAVPGGRSPALNAEEGWGANRMGGETAPDGSSFRLRIRLPGCEADFRATYEDGSAEARRDVDVCRTPTVTFDGSGIPRPPERGVTFVNRHGARIDEVYVSSSTEGDWGPERLPGGLGRGERQLLTLPVDCVVDLRVVFPTGGAEERREVNICQVPVVAVRPGWTIAARLDEGEEDDDGPRPGSIRLRNTAALPVVELYVDAPGEPRGPDRLGATVLGRNETLDIAPPEGAGCPARLTAVFRDGREVTRDPIDLCAGIEVPLP